MSVFGLVSALVGSVGGPAAATTPYANPATITLRYGQATPYPSTISVPVSGVITDVNVTVTGFYDYDSENSEFLLVGPSGREVVLKAVKSYSGSIYPNVNLTYDDEASGTFPSSTTVSSGGTYRPDGGNAFDGTAPAPNGPFGNALSTFDGTSPNGTWELFVWDNFSTDYGSIGGGWSLDITLAAPTIVAFSPRTGQVGDSVVLTGTDLTGATAVTFGRTPAAFQVRSDTEITTTVPKGAGAGPIKVTTPGGTATTRRFVVDHKRKISLALHGTKASGRVNVVDRFAGCASSVPVKIQHFGPGRWTTVAGVLTHTDGSFGAQGLAARGRYRAVAKRTKLSSGDVCLKQISPTAQT